MARFKKRVLSAAAENKTERRAFVNVSFGKVERPWVAAEGQKPIADDAEARAFPAVVVVSASALRTGGGGRQAVGSSVRYRSQMKDSAGSEEPALRNASERGDSRRRPPPCRQTGFSVERSERPHGAFVERSQATVRPAAGPDSLGVSRFCQCHARL
ncbi:hypothetical protein MRX96_006464 [Rhipicephalus microplus]